MRTSGTVSIQREPSVTATKSRATSAMPTLMANATKATPDMILLKVAASFSGWWANRDRPGNRARPSGDTISWDWLAGDVGGDTVVAQESWLT